MMTNYNMHFLYGMPGTPMSNDVFRYITWFLPYIRTWYSTHPPVVTEDDMTYEYIDALSTLSLEW
jgi:hypothetical protein